MRKFNSAPGVPVLAFGVGVIILLLLWSLWHERKSDLDLARTNASYVAELMGASVRRSVDDLSDLLHGVRSVSDLVMREQTKTDRLQALDSLVAELLERKPYVRTFFVVSPAGEIQYWNREGQAPIVYDRQYVQYHLDNPDSGFYVAPPVRSKLDNTWIVVASLPIRHESGELKSVVAASISPGFYAPLLLQESITRDVNLGILTTAGEVVWSNIEQTGTPFLATDAVISTWGELQGRGSVELSSPADGLVKLIGYQQLEQTSLFVVASIPIDTVLRGWRSQLVLSAVAISLLLIISIVIGRRLTTDHRCLLEQHLELKNMAMSDPLTGLPNRRHLWEQAELLMASAKRYTFSLAVIMLDIDHFKRINDTHGHDVGDTVIKALADLLLETARETDLTCRLGGEEFAIVFSHSDMHQATTVAERIREQVKQLSFDSDQETFGITVSIGVAALTDDMDRALKRADEGLYSAKNSGRDQVVATD